MSKDDSLFESLRDWLSTANPGLVTKADLEAVEKKLDGLLELVDEIEERLGPETPTDSEA